MLAIRGTEGIINKDLLSADLADIGITGFANHQAVDLYRYWKMLTTPAGKPVTYSSTEATMLYNMRNGTTSDGLNLDAHNKAVGIFNANLYSDVGIGALLGSNPQVTVTGHSLGGHLAYLFARMFPSNTGEVVTLNGPGLDGEYIGTKGTSLLTALGFPNVPTNNVTAINAEGDYIHTLGSVHPGKAIDISQENYGVAEIKGS